MKNLRDLLNLKNPELHSALEKAWDVAHNEVFPALPAKGESFTKKFKDNVGSSIAI